MRSKRLFKADGANRPMRLYQPAFPDYIIHRPIRVQLRFDIKLKLNEKKKKMKQHSRVTDSNVVNRNIS